MKRRMLLTGNVFTIFLSLMVPNICAVHYQSVTIEIEELKNNIDLNGKSQILPSKEVIKQKIKEIFSSISTTSATIVVINTFLSFILFVIDFGFIIVYYLSVPFSVHLVTTII